MTRETKKFLTHLLGIFYAGMIILYAVLGIMTIMIGRVEPYSEIKFNFTMAGSLLILAAITFMSNFLYLVRDKNG